MKKLFFKAKSKLSADETQEIITPFAFKLDPSLYGTPIAGPMKRGFAILIDLLLIAILSSAGGEFLAITLAILAFRYSQKQQQRVQELTGNKVKGKKRRAFMRLVGVFLLFLVLMKVIPPIVNPLMEDERKGSMNNVGDIHIEQNGEELSKGLQVGALIIKTIKKASDLACQNNVDCWKQVFEDIPEQALEFNLDQNKAKDLFNSIAEQTELSLDQKNKLVAGLESEYLRLVAQKNEANNTTEQKLQQTTDTSPTVKQEQLTGVDEEIVQATQSASQLSGQEPKHQPVKQPVYSIIKLIRGIIDDLGLGFGWAALYFTYFTSRWHGQTPGKKLFSIRVIQLDGTELSLWDSFGRYGGYGAGIATGLLGFLQIYWDPNRQAIHDQISATVVIDDNKKVDPEIVQKAKSRYLASVAEELELKTEQVKTGQLEQPIKTQDEPDNKSGEENSKGEN
ncbi:RDD family protein [Thalassotalea aquiviva]|uniref:RDD family protein n=1 Tax=Thalassotalea aquiviva TaxID=3242415 RepID=UPI00352A9CD9